MTKPNLSILALDSPAQLSSVVDSNLAYKISSLQMVKTAWGGSWSANLQLDANQIDVEDWLINGLARQIFIHNDGGQIIWRGFVSETSGNIGGLSIRYGPLLDTVKNRVLCAYSTVDYSVIPPAVGMRDKTVWADELDSQAIYGIIEYVKSVGGCAVGEPDQIRDVTLAESAFPKPKESDNLASSGTASVSLSCLGDVHWLKAYTYNDTTTGEVNASAKLQSILAADPNSIFSTDYSNITTNTTQVGAWENDDASAFALVKGITSLGDSTNARWLFYLDGNNAAHYEAVPTSPEYQRQLADPSQYVRTIGGGSIALNWNIETGKWIFYTDLMPQYNNISYNDPRWLFIEQITFGLPYSATLEGGRVDRIDQLLARLGLAGGIT